MVKMFGACYFSMGAVISLITLLTELVREKEYRLRNGLNVVGVGHNVYWCHWIVVAVGINTVQCLVLMIGGYVAGFDYWDHCPFGLLFYIFFWYGMTMIAGAFWLSTFITTLE